jgi:putative transposase
MTLTQDYPARLVCRLLEFPRCQLYRRPAPAPNDEADLRTALERLAGEWPTYGYRRLTALLRREAWDINPKRVRRVMASLGILGRPPVRRPRTTHSAHGFPRHPNLVEALEIVRPEQVWVADITYIRLRHDFVYLAVLMDVFTRAIRGWNLSRNLDQELTLTALDRALRRRTPQIHHSDQGVQYAAAAYVARLERHAVAISMAAVGEPRENGYAERLMRTIKEEEVELSEYQDFADAYRRLGRFLEAVYNVKRIHSALGYLTPREFEARSPVGRLSRPRLQSPLTGAEDRATVGTDPSADSGAKTAGRAAGSRPAQPCGIGTKR